MISRPGRSPAVSSVSTERTEEGKGEARLLDFGKLDDKGVLITGGAGFIGSHLAEHFIRQGHKVFVIDDLSTGFSFAVPDGVALRDLLGWETLPPVRIAYHATLDGRTFQPAHLEDNDGILTRANFRRGPEWQGDAFRAGSPGRGLDFFPVPLAELGPLLAARRTD